MTEEAKELWPTVEIEWEGEKYTCNLDFGWAYRLDVKCGINLLDFEKLENSVRGPKEYVGYVWAALTEHKPQITPEIVAAKLGKKTVTYGLKIFLAFLDGLKGESPKKKLEAPSH